MTLFKLFPALLTLIFLASPMLLLANDANSSFFDSMLSPSPYDKPFISEIHSTMVKIEQGYGKSYKEFNLTQNNKEFDRPVVEVHIGAQIPLFAANYGFVGDKPGWGLAISIPISVHILEDMYEPNTAPVINTDYRFGSPRIAYIRYFHDDSWIKNFTISWLPLFHECTHLGDEMTIYRINQNIPIIRANVSYEYTELQFTINDPGHMRETLNSFKFGLLYRISNRGLGWFDFRKGVETNQDLTIPASSYRMEYYLQYQFQRSEGFLASTNALNILSIEVRNRVRYGIPIYKLENSVWIKKEVEEELVFCLNAYFGWKFFPNKAEYNNALGLFFHFYQGLNP
jgi:hypothetical protein